MKIIVGPNLSKVTDSVRTHPNRIYFCGNCNRICIRKDVRKDSDGVYHCSECGKPVQDITDTDHGRDFAARVGL